MILAGMLSTLNNESEHRSSQNACAFLIKSKLMLSVMYNDIISNFRSLFNLI